MVDTLSGPPRPQHDFKCVAILFSGGPAPAANAVISTAAAAFLRNGIEVIGVKNGYDHLMKYGPDHPMQEGRDYIQLTEERLRRTRNKRGVMIGTARANPGKGVDSPADLTDEEKTAALKTVYDALRSLGVQALVSIGGDDTLKTANKFARFQVEAKVPESERIRVVHVPKTIDNDYAGIDFTFGYFTAVETLAEEIRNMLADAEADRSYFLAETMGRSAGWLAYGAAIASEASFVISVEDIQGEYRGEETYEDKDGVKHTRTVMNIDAVTDKIVNMMWQREVREGKDFGVIVIAEGLAEYLPYSRLKDVPRDEHGHISIAQVDVAKFMARHIETAFADKVKQTRKIKPVQLGYESRCARPHAFDVMLGSQLGVGAFRAIVERNLDSVMVSVSGQLDLQFVEFDKLVDPKTLVTVVRFVGTESDFHKLARFLESHVNE